jgi:hypothetical protein
MREDSPRSHHGRRRAFGERVDSRGRIRPILGQGFTSSELDDLAAKTRWLKYRSLTLQDEFGDVRIEFDKNTPFQTAIKYRDQHYPRLKVVFWQGETPKAKGVTRIF